MQLYGQITGLIAMVAIILSFQCKSNKNLVLVIGTGASLFAVSYFMLGQPSSAIINIIGALCSIVSINKKLKNKYMFVAIALMYVTATLLTFNDWWSFVLMTAQITASYCIMFKNGTTIRNNRLFFVSPVWLVNNTVICFTLGGMLCEIITMISIIVSFIRYKKTGFSE